MKPLCESNLHAGDLPPRAVVQVNLYDFDPETNGDTVTTMRLCEPCEEIAAGDYPDNIELVERYEE